jgi:hypothetical protein
MLTYAAAVEICGDMEHEIDSGHVDALLSDALPFRP